MITPLSASPKSSRPGRVLEEAPAHCVCLRTAHCRQWGKGETSRCWPQTQLSQGSGQWLPPQTGRTHFQFLRGNSNIGRKGGGQASGHTKVVSCGQETDVQHTRGVRAPSTCGHTATGRAQPGRVRGTSVARPDSVTTQASQHSLGTRLGAR